MRQSRKSLLESCATPCSSLIDRGAVAGNGSGLHLSADMVRMMVYNRRMGLYK